MTITLLADARFATRAACAPRRGRSWLAAACAALLLVACGGGDDTPAPATALAPTITSQPAAVMVTEGQAASFTVTATGTAPLTYQWQRNGAAIAGAAGAGYTLAAATPADSNASFSVVVSNAAGNVVSSAAVLTVNALAVLPQVTLQPAPAAIIVGGVATFTAAVSGSPAPALRWSVVGGADLADGAASGPLAGATIAGASTSTLTLSTVPLSANGISLRLRASNAAGSVDSGAAGLAVTAAPVQIGPAGGTVTSADGRVTVTVAAGEFAAAATITIEPIADIVLPPALAQDAVMIAGTSYSVNIAGAPRTTVDGITFVQRVPATVALAQGKSALSVRPLATTDPSNTTSVRRCGQVVETEPQDPRLDQAGGKLGCLDANPDAPPVDRVDLGLARPVLETPSAVEWSNVLAGAARIYASDMDATGRVAVVYSKDGGLRARILRPNGGQLIDFLIPGGCPDVRSGAPAVGSCQGNVVARLDEAGNLSVAGSRRNTSGLSDVWAVRVRVVQSSLLGAVARSTWRRDFLGLTVNNTTLFAIAAGPAGDLYIGGLADGPTPADVHPLFNARGGFVAKLAVANGGIVWSTPTAFDYGAGVGARNANPVALAATPGGDVIFVARGTGNQFDSTALARVSSSGQIVQVGSTGGLRAPGALTGQVGLTLRGEVPIAAGTSGVSDTGLITNGGIVVVEGLGGAAHIVEANSIRFDYWPLNSVGLDSAGRYVVWGSDDIVRRINGSTIDGRSDRSPTSPFVAYSQAGPSRIVDAADNILLVGQAGGARAGIPAPPAGTYYFIQKIRLQ